MADPTTGNLIKAKTIASDEVNAAVDVFLTGGAVRLFGFGSGHTLDLAAAVKASRHASATLSEPTAKNGARRLAVRTAILLARPTAP
ncbi:hypothetical protein MKK70_26780 [Methylobacterium sp. E-041]|uniref:hypothetical protein n=1 Tax=Methylobacterium sp. E-041 TaxID=2836573 RepID=UPI001FBA7873|nr:hypothetical protein [Methylobacterium sp. E-041]MCJ2108914.1 hypothetical protein [Methylobacterium sp. E-041]